MSLLDRFLGISPVTTAAMSATLAGPEPTSIADMDPNVARAFGFDVGNGDGPVTREMALQVPAIRRGQSLIAGTIGTLSLACNRTAPDGSWQPVERTLLRVLDPRTTPMWTLTRTADDLMFYPCAWWRVLTRDYTGYPETAERIDPRRVQVQKATAYTLPRVFIDGREVADRDIIRFDSPDEGLLKHGGRTVRLALALMEAARRIADNDVPLGMLTTRNDADKPSTEPNTAPDGSERSMVEWILDEWEAARRDRDTGYLDALDYKTIAFNATERQLTELQQLVSTELSRLMNLPPSRIGAPQGSGMTYTNTEADRRDLVDTTLAPYLTAIQQRLSMGDVTPLGQSVTFDLTGYIRGTVSELIASAETAIRLGITDAAEVRTKWLGLPPRTDLKPAAQPTPTTPSEEA